jgi:hypothetical protein
MPYQTQNIPYMQPAFSAQPVNQQGGPPGVYAGYPNPNQPADAATRKQPKAPINIDNWLKMLLYIILPVRSWYVSRLRTRFLISIRYLFMTFSARPSVCCVTAIVQPFAAYGDYHRLRIAMHRRAGVMLSGSNNDIQATRKLRPSQPPLITDEPRPRRWAMRRTRPCHYGRPWTPFLRNRSGAKAVGIYGQ